MFPFLLLMQNPSLSKSYLSSPRTLTGLQIVFQLCLSSGPSILSVIWTWGAAVISARHLPICCTWLPSLLWKWQPRKCWASVLPCSGRQHLGFHWVLWSCWDLLPLAWHFCTEYLKCQCWEFAQTGVTFSFPFTLTLLKLFLATYIILEK